MGVVKRIEDVAYPAPYWWNKSVNPEASVANGLGNCTCFVYGAALAAGFPAPVSVITDARNWHKYLANGWVCVPYADYKSNLKVGDIIEWETGNHVAIVSDMVDDTAWISGSFYTGIHGSAYYDGGYDTREGIATLQQLNDFMVNNYQYRFFHYVPLSEEARWCGGEPDYVLVAPLSIVPTERDMNYEQVYVGVTGLRVRTEPNTSSQMRGVAANGYYNISAVVTGGDFGEGDTWYKIGDHYIASVNGVIYYPKEQIMPLEEMMKLMQQMKDTYLKVCAERDMYKDELEKIRRIVNE